MRPLVSSAYALVLFENNDAEGRVPAPVPQLSGDGAPYDPCSHNADVIRVHLAGSLASRSRPSAQCSGCYRDTSTARAAQSERCPHRTGVLKHARPENSHG